MIAPKTVYTDERGCQKVRVRLCSEDGQAWIEEDCKQYDCQDSHVYVTLSEWNAYQDHQVQGRLWDLFIREKEKELMIRCRAATSEVYCVGRCCEDGRNGTG